MRIRMFALAAVMVAAFGSTAASATEFVKNGNFSQTTATTSRQMVSDDGKTQYVSNWSTGGYNFIVFNGDGTKVNGIQTNVNGPLYFWGKYSDAADAVSNGFTDSTSIKGSGGNYLAADGAFGVSAISQVLTGLTVGRQYDLSFNWAAAQQHGYDGATTDNWTASLTSATNAVESYTTATVLNREHGFVGWRKQTFVFTATSATETLSFLAKGTPDGKPPFSLLDDVSFTEHVTTAVPEPASWATMLAGFGGVGLAMRRRRAQPRTA